MTSPARRETAETAETAETPEAAETPGTVLAYSGGVIDRAASQRTEPGWVDAILAKASTRLIPMWREARWFTRAELTEHAKAAGRLGREDSIDRYLLRSWLEDTT